MHLDRTSTPIDLPTTGRRQPWPANLAFGSGREIILLVIKIRAHSVQGRGTLMLGSGIASVTAPLAPRPGGRGGDANPARGSAEAPIVVPTATGSTTDRGAESRTTESRTAGAITQPAMGSEATRSLAVSQTIGAVSPDGVAADKASPDGPATDKTSPDGLTAGERDVVRQLAARDREVRQHEQAHARAGGAQAGSPSFSYQTGPDGKRYAVGGSVPIDTAPVKGDPEATIAKMAVVIAAALAPASPSGPDRRIAAQAQSTRLAALSELAASRGRGAASPDQDPEITSNLFTHLARPEPEGEHSRTA
jgi:hypothetical protein